MFCHTVLTTRFPWVHLRVHHATPSHLVSCAHVRLPGTKDFQKNFPQKNTAQYPWLGEEMRDWPCLKDLALSWWISARFFDAAEICELRLHTVTCLASLYVGKHRTNSAKPYKNEFSPGYREQATTDPSSRKHNLFLYSCLYFYVLTAILNFSSKLAVIYAPSLGCQWASLINAFKCFICRQENATAVRSLRAKIVIVGNSKWVKNHHFCAQLSHCFSIYQNTYSPHCRWLGLENNGTIVLKFSFAWWK